MQKPSEKCCERCRPFHTDEGNECVYQKSCPCHEQAAKQICSICADNHLAINHLDEDLEDNKETL